MRLQWFLIIVLCSGAYAIGIGPAQVYLVYEPGVVHELDYVVFGSIANVTVRGELKESISCTLGTSLNCTLTMPAGLAPGPHEAEIILIETRTKESGIINAEPAAVSRLRVDVPRPGKYAEGRLEYGSGRFSVYVHNFGSERIEDAYAEISAGGKTLITDHATVAPMSEVKMTGAMELSKGRHSATAKVHYDGASFDLLKEIVSGEPGITIRSIQVDPFAPGEISRIRMRLLSDWPEPVTAYGEAVISSGTVEVIQTETFEILDEREVSAYWNTAGKPIGDYNATASIYYGDKVSTKVFMIGIKEQENDYGRIFFAAIVVLLAILVFLLLWVRKPPRSSRKTKSSKLIVI